MSYRVVLTLSRRLLREAETVLGLQRQLVAMRRAKGLYSPRDEELLLMTGTTLSHMRAQHTQLLNNAFDASTSPDPSEIN